ncbi:MAG: hypothetical protein AB8C40_04485, partial [Gammaproteobacteria bacterium]
FRDLIFLQENLQHWLDNIHVYNTMLNTRKARYEETAPAAGKTLKRSQLKRFQKKYNELSENLNKAEANNDVLAFVNDKELLSLKRIERLQKKLTKLNEEYPSEQEYIDGLERLNILRGRIYWNVSQEYSQRQWQAKTELMTIEQEISNLIDVESSIATVDQVASFGFGGFQYRIDEIKQRIEQTMPRLVVAYQKQSELIESLAVRELHNRKLVMKSYRAQAKLALAQAYDQATIDNPEIIGEEE